MLAKLAILFLVVMGAMALVLARPRRRGRDKPKRRTELPPRAVKCPDCGSWIVEGARCPCRKGGRE